MDIVHILKIWGAIAKDYAGELTEMVLAHKDELL
jgi:hypothetical protein